MCNSPAGGGDWFEDGTYVELASGQIQMCNNGTWKAVDAPKSAPVRIAAEPAAAQDVGKVVKETVVVERPVEVTKIVKETVIVASTPVVVERVVRGGLAGIPAETIKEYLLSDTNDTGSLIAVLNRDWESGQFESGDWSAYGVSIPDGSVGWFDTHTGQAPANAVSLRSEGGWGVWYFPAGFVTEAATAGRWMKVEGNINLAAAPTAKTVDPCANMPDFSGMTVDDGINAANKWFEKSAWAIGSDFAPGGKLPIWSVFWTNFEGPIPAGAQSVLTNGGYGIFLAREDLIAVSGGRVVYCGGK